MRGKLLFTAILLSALSLIPISAQRIDYQKADSQRVASLFKKARGQRHSMGSYMVFFGRQLCGLPYVAKTLEKNKEERLVVNLRQLDCTTYVETVLALSRCMMQGKPTFENYCTQLRLIRYARGVVSYPTRQHYFTYWIKQNAAKGIVRDIQSPNPPFTTVQTVRTDYMTTHVSQYPMLVGHPTYLADIKAMEKAITGLKPRYIPERQLRNTQLIRNTVHDGDIIGIVTTKAGLDISHLGIAVWHKDGLHMLNASSIYHKVVEDNDLLYTYLKRKKTSVGIRIVRPTKNILL